MTRYLPLAVVAVLAVALGLVYGVETDRWRTSQELEVALGRLETLPAEIGDWKATDLAYEAGDLARAGIRGAVFRRYENARTGAAVSILVVCGRGGPISVHTPDVCYTGAGYRAVGAQQKKAVPVGPGGDRADFWVLQFAKPDAVVPTRLEIYWAWSAGGPFEVPDNPRFTYARAPALYKLYVVREFAPTSRADKDNPCEQFLARALPEFRAALGRTSDDGR
ncbi:MAG: exosortase-associated EpsI family protein [Zavarzinella sp.]|nr:exosortase-associated EpsI family protein [Zavarzinella sp.]